MALDDQLAALAAGELDDDTARALRARASADPALARRLARHEQLQQLLSEWQAPAMPDDAVQRLQERVDAALAALGEEPLADRTPAHGSLVAVPDPDTRQQPREVIDLGRERNRRAATAGGGTLAWPSWGAGVAVAAVLAAIVGTGIVLGGLPGGGGLDVIATDDAEQEQTAQVAEDSAGEDEAFTGGAADSGAAEPPVQDTEQEAATDDGAATSEETAQLGPVRRRGVDVAEGELLGLVDLASPAASRDSAEEEDAADGEAATGETAAQCVTEALQRDTDQAEDRQVWLLADGSYAGRDAAFVVVRTPAPGQDRYEVLAYAPDDCSLLARDETSG